MKPASEAQRDYLNSLAGSLRWDHPIKKKIRAGTLTHDDCVEWIPKLKERKKRLDDEQDWASPEGYDYSPDMGVHQYDGGGTFF